MNVKKIFLYFRKFCVDFADKYKTTPIQLSDDAKTMLINYRWPGNIRELKNIAEQMSMLATQKLVNSDELHYFLPHHNAETMPMITGRPLGENGSTDFANEREILYKLFFDMKKDVNDLKKMFFELAKNPSVGQSYVEGNAGQEASFLPYDSEMNALSKSNSMIISNNENQKVDSIHPIEETLNLAENEKDFIIKALKKHRSRRRDAASELGISERTLYRKIKEYDIEE